MPPVHGVLWGLWGLLHCGGHSSAQPCNPAGSFPCHYAACTYNPLHSTTPTRTWKGKGSCRKWGELCPYLQPGDTRQGCEGALCAEPHLGEAAALLSPQRWLGSISKLHRQQLKGPLLPRFHRATWQQVAIPETSLSPGPHCPRRWEGSGSSAPSLLAVLLVLPSAGARAEHIASCHYPAAQGRGWVLLSWPEQHCFGRESVEVQLGCWDGLACVLALA